MSARYLFDRVVAGGWAGLLQWQADKEPETFQLEFKGVGHDAPKLKEYDRDETARAVSGFANTSGGVLLVGVDTAKDGAVDRVDRLRPAGSLAAYAQAINDHVRTCVVPHVPGAHAVPIPDPSGTDRGIVAVFVPTSDGGPHRVVTGSDAVKERYYTRIGTSFHVLSHDLLAAMFGRRPPPRLRLALCVDSARNAVVFYVVNTGRGVARDVLVSVEVARVLPFEIARQDIRVFGHWERAFRAPHPGSTLPPAAYHFALPAPHLLHADDVHQIGQVALPHADCLRVRGRIVADGMTRVTIDTEVSPGVNELACVTAVGDDDA